MALSSLMLRFSPANNSRLAELETGCCFILSVKMLGFFLFF